MEALPIQPLGVVAIDVYLGNPIGYYHENQVQMEDRICCSTSYYHSSSMEVELEPAGLSEIETETNPHLDTEVELDCRICHLTLDPNNHESGVPIELGCSCKDDLAAAHKHCAEAWFKIKGDRTCEICGTTAQNVVVAAAAAAAPAATESDSTETWNEGTESTAGTGPATTHVAETRNFWKGHRFLNFLLACMVFAFVLSWLFHFNVSS